MTTPHTFSLALPSDLKSYEVKFSVNQVPSDSEFDEKASLKAETQHLLKAQEVTPAALPAPAPAPVVASASKCPFISMPGQFQIHAVDKKLNPTITKPAPVDSAPLGVLTNFSGNFAGKGMNLIFRPNSGPPTTTLFPKPVTPAPPAVPSENVLEINLTTENLTFSTPLGSVPNRGLQQQNDIILNGVPYLQTVNDVTNVYTGKGDASPTPIHFEPGLWMHIPATNNDPVNAESLVRMASIPHGTTINAQLQKMFTVNGPPNIPSTDITPFPIGSTQQANPIKFASQTAANDDTPRIPQDLTKFIAAGTITQDILNDPNTVLRNAIKGQKITETVTFIVSTIPTSPEQGGGTANIAFLEGAAASTTSKGQTGPNADAASMTAVFWVEKVQHTIVVPPFKPGQPPLRLQPTTAALPDAHVPTFEVTPPHEITSPKTIIVESTQIQYSQLVILNFANLSWPHVSVATLVPSEAQHVPASAWN